MKTKKEEVKITTNEVDILAGKYLSKNLLRGWKEKFVDEDSGEVVEVERNEIIYPIGTYLGNDEISKILFHQQSGDIEEVEVSDTKRACVEKGLYSVVWEANCEINGKAHKIFLYAKSITMAHEITTDFVSQAFEGTFRITSLKSCLLYTSDAADD